MKKFSSILVISMLAIFLVGGTAMAVPFDPSGSYPQLEELQGVFDGITQSGTSSIDVYSDETQSEIFTPQTSGITSTYVISASWAAGDFTFGFYEVGNISNTLVLFDTSLDYGDPGDSTQVYLDYGSDSMTSYYFPGGTYTVIDTAEYMPLLGFYGDPVNYGTYYSQSDLNPGAYDRFLTYLAKGDMVDPDGDGNYLNDAGHWYVAAELWDSLGYDPTKGDYTDIVVQFESITPAVPEPATMLLLGSGLIGLAGLGRRKFFKKS